MFFNSLTATLFHSFVRKKCVLQQKYYVRLHLFVNVCRGVFRTLSSIYGGASWRKSQNRFIADAQLGSEYVSSIGFTVEKVYKSHYSFDIVKADFKNLS